MTVEYNIIKNLPNNKVIIAESKTNTSKNNKPKYYLLNEKYADLFIKNKKHSDILTKTQLVLSMIIGASIAILAGINSKAHKTRNTLIGIGAGALVYAGGEYFDRWYQKNMNKRILKLFNAKEIQFNGEILNKNI